MLETGSGDVEDSKEDDVLDRGLFRLFLALAEDCGCVSAEEDASAPRRQKDSRMVYADYGLYR